MSPRMVRMLGVKTPEKTPNLWSDDTWTFLCLQDQSKLYFSINISPLLLFFDASKIPDPQLNKNDITRLRQLAYAFWETVLGR
jgi:hypothetical protein